jgi:hypothetical protein
LGWENSGDIKGKNSIPAQLTHSLNLEYSIKDGLFNVSLSVVNAANTLTYDNFNIQTPGRAIYLKLRYYIKKVNN